MFIPDLDVDYSINGFQCISRCGMEGIFKGKYWCHTLDSWDFCTPNNQGKCIIIKAGHTYPRLYLEKKKCPWKMTLVTFFKC